MKCNLCGTDRGVLWYSRLVNNDIIEIFLCHKCRVKMMLLANKFEKEGQDKERILDILYVLALEKGLI